MRYQDYSLEDVNTIPRNGLKVFSAFSCGGGSSIGYKLAGFDVIGINDIDPSLTAVYKANFNPKFVFQNDIRDLLGMDLPEELYNLDILDGSPPCSVFSMLGNREEDWGKSKKFKEGQKRQTLDDLFFVFIDLARRLQPRVVIAENVKGLMLGKAKGYLTEISKAFDNAGYNPNVYLLNSAYMGVPQRRERVFFVATRKDLNLPVPVFNYENKEGVVFGEIKSNTGVARGLEAYMEKLLLYKRITDNSLQDISKRVYNKPSYFSIRLLKDNEIPPTMASGSSFIVYSENRQASSTELCRIQSFPRDYNFLTDSYTKIKYILGMSVPPYMMKFVADAVYKQLFKDSGL